MVRRVILVLILLMVISLSCSNKEPDSDPVSGDLKCTSLTISTISGGQFRTAQSVAGGAMLLRGCEIRNWGVSYVLGVAVSVSFDRCCEE